MIRKPAADWQREAPALATVREVAKGTAAAARTGGHVARAMVCWAFALLWGFAALAGGLFGSLPTFIGVGAMAAFMGWSGMRALAKARGERPATIDDNRDMPHSAGQRVIEYDAARLVRSAVICGALACVGFWLFGVVHGITSWVVAIAVPALIVLAIGSLAKIFGDRVALRYDERSLTVATLWRRRTVPWSQVSDIGITRLETYAFYGLVRTGSTDMLVIRIKGGLFGDRKLSIMPRLLDLGGRTLAGLVADIGPQPAGTAPVPATTGHDMPRMRPTAPQALVYPEKEAEFDPDAVIARYLAQKAQAEQAICEAQARTEIAGAPQRRQFGRKIV